MPLAPGQVLQGRYVIQSQLGQGGMSTVYQALHRGLNQYVALKESFSSDLAANMQFQNEAAILARLSHLNLPHVTDFFIEPDGTRYLVMEYVEGQNLEQIVQQRGAFDEKYTLALIKQIFEAVKYLHVNHVIHLDIKPQNIIITPQGKAVLVDFGIAKAALPGRGPLPNSQRIGTPGYAPPEQYSGETDERSDIYALGATLYFLLTANAPPESKIVAAGQAALVSPRKINSALSVETEKAILTAMEIEIGRRFGSIDAFEHSLPASPILDAPAVISQPSSGAQTAVTGMPVSRRTPRPTGGVPSAPGLVIFIGAAFAVLVLWLFTVVSHTAVGETPTQTVMQPLFAPSAISTNVETTAPSAVPVVEPSATDIVPQKRLDPVIGVAYDEAGHSFQGAFAVNATILGSGSQTQIFLTSGFVSSAVWSPDGSKALVSFWGIPYGTDRYDVRVLRFVNADGSNGIDVAKSNPHGGDRLRGFVDAIWSPTGQLMAFLREELGNSCVFLMSPSGAGLHKLDSCEANDDPRYWSVDGKWIVVRARSGGFYALDVDGRQRVPLDQLGKIQMYDERYWPWRIIDSPVCKTADFWSCE